MLLDMREDMLETRVVIDCIEPLMALCSSLSTGSFSTIFSPLRNIISKISSSHRVSWSARERRFNCTTGLMSLTSSVDWPVEAAIITKQMNSTRHLIVYANQLDSLENCAVSSRSGGRMVHLGNQATSNTPKNLPRATLLNSAISLTWNPQTKSSLQWLLFGSLLLSNRYWWKFSLFFTFQLSIIY